MVAVNTADWLQTSLALLSPLSLWDIHSWHQYENYQEYVSGL